ncbi:asparaginase [Ensifer sp. LCM 4579]|uniref:asparaginase n=1 Tax=Ensifer sp. LCM 4579 TaxID=1848292 RepID=UPI0008D9E6D7|nr:asparaginase [Ensifer sp. LCM 4579]OHV75739.1 hypothetical protein LCM4579_27985 [Ensifer sp. LCM 4579]
MDTRGGNVLVLATGGSIAQTSPSDPTLTAEVLLEAIPELRTKFRITVEQIAQVSSPDVTPELWLRLASRINKALADDNVRGIVVTHGTDTLEETAYFLNLVVESEKPVVVAGAMRRPYSLGADGAANFHNAVVVANSTAAKGRGVLATFNSEIHSARDVTKTTSNLDAFKSPNFGPLGCIVDERPHFYRTLERKHTAASALHIETGVLPPVAILYSYAGVASDILEATMAGGYKGIVWAGTGSGNVPKSIRPAAAEAVRKGVVFVRSSRLNSYPIKRNDEVDDDALGFVTADSLNPQKARVLLMLSLTQTRDPVKIQEFFATH